MTDGLHDFKSFERTDTIAALFADKAARSEETLDAAGCVAVLRNAYDRYFLTRPDAFHTFVAHLLTDTRQLMEAAGPEGAPQLVDQIHEMQDCLRGDARDRVREAVQDMTHMAIYAFPVRDPRGFQLAFGKALPKRLSVQLHGRPYIPLCS